MTWVRLVSFVLFLVAAVCFVRGESGQGSALVAVAVVFLVVGEQRSRSVD